MKYLFNLLFIILINTMSVYSQNQSLLWEVSGNGLESNSYLFGTIHITCNASLSEKVQKAITNTDQIVLEIDLDAPDTQAEFMQHMYMEGGKKVADILSEEEYQLINNLFIKNLGVNMDAMGPVKPYFLMANLYPIWVNCTPQSIEGELLKIAQTSNKEIKGLETVFEQMSAFDKIPAEDFIADLVRSAKDNMAYDKKKYTELLDFYAHENIDALLENQKDENYKSVSKHVSILIDDRNKTWIPRIIEMMKSKRSFFAFGAAHLAGDNGIISLLRNEGYTLTPIYD